MGGFAEEVAKTRELQLLAVEIVLLVVIVMAIAVEEVLRKNNNAVIRSYLVALVYLTLMLSSVSHIARPLSVYGWLVGCHVAAFAAWAGLVCLLTLGRDADARFTRVAAQRFSQLAAVTSVVVLVTGGALGLGWAAQDGAEVLTSVEGWALVAEVLIGLVLTLGIGYGHRRLSLPQLEEGVQEGGQAKTTLPWRLGLIELVGMAAATTFGVIL